MEREEYSVQIIEVSKDIRAIEKIRLKDLSLSMKINDMVKAESVVIEPDYYASLHIINENSENKEYDVFVIVDKEGQHYHTGSRSFHQSFIDIAEELKGEPDLRWGIECYSVPSKDPKNNNFLKCSVVEL